MKVHTHLAPVILHPWELECNDKVNAFLRWSKARGHPTGGFQSSNQPLFTFICTFLLKADLLFQLEIFFAFLGGKNVFVLFFACARFLSRHTVLSGQNDNTIVGGWDVNPPFAHFRGFIADSSTVKDVMCQCFNKRKTTNAESSRADSSRRTGSIKWSDIWALCTATHTDSWVTQRFEFKLSPDSDFHSNHAQLTQVMHL